MVASCCILSSQDRYAVFGDSGLHSWLPWPGIRSVVAAHRPEADEALGNVVRDTGQDAKGGLLVRRDGLRLVVAATECNVQLADGLLDLPQRLGHAGSFATSLDMLVVPARGLVLLDGLGRCWVSSLRISGP